jgi:hypothetical protein
LAAGVSWRTVESVEDDTRHEEVVMHAHGHMWRSRWAAIGAAVAVTLGVGGWYSVRANSPASNFVAISPTRVLNTRIDAGLTGQFGSATPRLLDVTGTIPIVLPGNVISSGAPVPDGATAIVANVTVVTPTTNGFVSVRPGDATGSPATASVNFSSPGVVVGNSVTVELPTAGINAGQIQLWFQGTIPSATTHLVIDILGYYTPNGAVSAWDTIPSGRTVTGEIVWDYSAASLSSDRIGVTFPALAPVDLSTGNVNFAPDGSASTTDDDASCTGTLAAPTAPPGKVCIYRNNSSANLNSINGAQNLTLRRAGFYIDMVPNATSQDTFLYATWAYTAP